MAAKVSARIVHIASIAGALGACFSPSDDDEPGSGSSSVGSDSGSETGAGPSSGPGEEEDSGGSSGGDDDSGSGSGGDVCGDGMVTGDEICDDGVNDGSYDGCEPGCSALGPMCGDGITNGDEACDDSDAQAADGCNPDCVISGTALWCQTFDGVAGLDDAGSDVAIGPDDVIVVAGNEGLAGATRRAWVRQYDADGTPQWTQTWSPASGATAVLNAVGVGGSGQVVATGSTEGDILVLGYSPLGDLSWQRTETGGGPVIALAFSGGYGVAMDESGDAFVIGQLDGGMDGRDIWLRRYDANGNTVWTELVDGAGAGPDLGRGIDISGNMLAVVGRLGAADGLETWVRRYDTGGTPVWTETDSVGYIATDVAIDPDGNLAVVGAREVWVRQYDSNGNTQWTETDDTFAGEGVCTDGDGNVIVAGYDGTQAWLRKHDSDGVELWTEQAVPAAGTTFAAATKCAVDSAGNIVVVGTSASGNSEDAFVCKHAP